MQDEKNSEPNLDFLTTEQLQICVDWMNSLIARNSEAIRSDAYDDGYIRGRAEGYDHGYSDGRGY